MFYWIWVTLLKKLHEMYIDLEGNIASSFNFFLANLTYLNVSSLEVVSRYRDPRP